MCCLCLLFSCARIHVVRKHILCRDAQTAFSKIENKAAFLLPSTCRKVLEGMFSVWNVRSVQKVRSALWPCLLHQHSLLLNMPSAWLSKCISKGMPYAWFFCSVIKTALLKCAWLFFLCSSVVEELKEAAFPVLRILLQHICTKVCWVLVHTGLKNFGVNTLQYM